VRPDHRPAKLPDSGAPHAPGAAELQRGNRFNKIARLILTSPLHRLLSKRLILISVTGRKTGTIYTTPVAYAADGGKLLIAAGGSWRHNLTAQPDVTVLLRGKTLRYHASVVRDGHCYQALLAKMAALNPTWARYTAIELGPGGQPTSAAVAEARARGLALATLTPIRPETSSDS
jgi:deazaflavin-dependent oxidoreductase (nitroreductase family)